VVVTADVYSADALLPSLLSGMLWTTASDGDEDLYSMDRLDLLACCLCFRKVLIAKLCWYNHVGWPIKRVIDL